jgi:hypothetical protein
MNRLPQFLAASCLAVSASAACIAQAPDAPPPTPFGAGGFRIGGPIMMSGGNTLVPLLRRSDVQSGIALSLRQKQQLAEILNSPQRITINMVNNGNLDEEARKKEMEKQVAAQLGGPEEKVKALLKPDQFERLQELLLQWKGPLILGDAKSADRLKLSPESRTDIAKAVNEYQAVKNEVMASLTQVNDTPGQDGPNKSLRRMVKVNTQELENQLSPAYKKLDAAKKDAEKRILDALDPAERDSWRKAQGAPFTFRTDIPGNRF